jgi:hypothetical protein
MATRIPGTGGRRRRRPSRIAITSAHGGVGYSAKSHPCRDKEIHHGFSCLQDHSSYWYFDLKRGRRGADGGRTSSGHGAQSQMVQSHGNSRLHQGWKDCSMASFCRSWLRSGMTFASGPVSSARKQRGTTKNSGVGLTRGAHWIDRKSAKFTAGPGESRASHQRPGGWRTVAARHVFAGRTPPRYLTVSADTCIEDSEDIEKILQHLGGAAHAEHLVRAPGPRRSSCSTKTRAPTSRNLRSESERGRPGRRCPRKSRRYEHRSAVSARGRRVVPCLAGVRKNADCTPPDS